ncbi:hypothetical protein Pcinc_002910 [Petrolisthes cinctipes]|uniref:HAT C-terminal dimerisation domain-containing protein n=1 Tax=Petrolisthes cinctipes TaxID=88211 RepID=A0AAE1GKB0_PETCI|nr:hypothetical protein Pcinc_002910 [Petrolisthes cinctipes]
MLCDEVNKLYLTFALPIIQNFESLNAAFQATNPDPSKLFKELEDLRTFLLQKVYGNPNERKNPWTPADGKLGDKLEFDLKNSILAPEKKFDIKDRCQKFLVEAINQIDKRIDKTTMKMSYIKNLTPAICLSQVKPPFSNLPELGQLAKEENYDLQTVANQYDQLSMKTDWREKFPGSAITSDPVAFWTYVLYYENAAGEHCYRELATIAINSYCIPLSTAFVERVFSHVTNVKTKVRNKLHTSSLEAILRIRSHMFTNAICCQNFEVTDKMLRLFTSDMYKRKPTRAGEDPQPSTSSASSSNVSTATEEGEDCSIEEILSIDF